MIMIVRRLAALLLALLVLPASALAAERVTDFDALITVEPTGMLRVTETITVVAEGKVIRRGIYRDLILPARSWRDAMIGPAYRVISAMRDKTPESWHTAEKGHAFTIYLGRKDVFLQPGTYTYTLAYEAASQVRRFDDHDEIYWNVTGNGWTLPVERARAVVTLPPGVDILQASAYTGPVGAKGQDFNVVRDEPGRIVFTSTRPLAPGEGLTVAVAWPKGKVSEPGFLESVLGMATANQSIMASLACFALMIAYFLGAWLKVGRDPAPGTVLPLFSPPRGMSPAAVRYVTKMGHDQKDLACTIVDLAVGGCLTIKEFAKGDFVLERTSGAHSPKTIEEDQVLATLFADGSPLEVDRTNRSALIKARTVLRKTLRDSYTGYLFNPNVGWFAPGAVLGAAAALFAALSGEQFEASVFMAFWLTFWSIGTVFLLSRVASSWHDALTGKGGFLKITGALFATAFALPFLAGELFGLFLFGANSSPLAVALLMGSVTACAAFFHLLKAPTREGRQVMDQIEGFKLYLTVAEEDRMNILNPPEMTPALFEKFLPYAMALGVAQQWGERFAGILAAASSAPNGYSPMWYHGSSWDSSSPGDFSDSLSSGFASALSSSTASSSSSGSGGGGSSGGGGGGGGGGGW